MEKEPRLAFLPQQGRLEPQSMPILTAFFRKKTSEFETNLFNSSVVELEEEVGQTILSWGDMEKTLGDFKLKTGEGEVRSAEVVGVVGPNATGKTTMVRMIAGEIEPDQGWCTMDAEISYKPQHVSTDFDGTVQDWLDTELGGNGEVVNSIPKLFVHYRSTNC